MQTSINLFKVPPFCVSLVCIFAGNLFEGLTWNVWREHFYNNLPNLMVDKVQNRCEGLFLRHTDGGIGHFFFLLITTLLDILCVLCVYIYVLWTLWCPLCVGGMYFTQQGISVCSLYGTSVGKYRMEVS